MLPTPFCEMNDVMKKILPWCASVFLATVALHAATMPYQGLATDAKGKPLSDSSYTVTFSLYDNAATITNRWSEQQLVTTKKGLFSVQLGAALAIPDTLFSNASLYLGVTFGNGGELVPRLKMAVNPWASRAGKADSARAAHLSDSARVSHFSDSARSSHVADSAKVAVGMKDSVSSLRSALASHTATIQVARDSIQKLNALVANQGNSIASIMSMLNSSVAWNPNINFGTLVDARDGQVYRTVVIGAQTWMAQNLNYAGSSNSVGICWPSSLDSCAKYGRVYDWTTAMGVAASFTINLLGASLPVQGICPSGWHLPSKPEWQTLQQTAESVVGPGFAGTYLKSKKGWILTAFNGNDSVGFRALPGGQKTLLLDGSVVNLGTPYAYFWTSTETANNQASQLYFDGGTSPTFGTPSPTWPLSYKSYMNSVRCIAN